MDDSTNSSEQEFLGKQNRYLHKINLLYNVA